MEDNVRSEWWTVNETQLYELPFADGRFLSQSASRRA